jgi:hypothetical protein
MGMGSSGKALLCGAVVAMFTTLACGGEDTAGSGAGTSAGGSAGGSGGSVGGSGGSGGSQGGGGMGPRDPRTVVVWADGTNGGINDIYVKELVDSAWVEVGVDSAQGTGISGGLSDSEAPAVALDAAGNPIVAWTEAIEGGPAQIYLRRFDGSQWVAMGSGSDSGGGVSDTMGNSSYPALVMDPDDNPILAWADAAPGAAQIYAKRWDGSAWVEIGGGSASGAGLSNGIGGFNTPALAIDPAGDPILAWGGPDIYALRFDGSEWVELGAGSATGGGISNLVGSSFGPDLAFDAAGMPIVAWSNNTDVGEFNIFVRRFDGSTWVEVGAGSGTGKGVTNAGAVAGTAQLLVDAGDVMTVLYDYGISNSNVHALRFDGSAWLGSLGTVSQSGWGAFPTAVLDDDDRVITAYRNKLDMADDLDIYAKRFDGNDWVELGGTTNAGDISDNDGWCQEPDMARR